jgi:hypothetical protein
MNNSLKLACALSMLIVQNRGFSQVVTPQFTSFEKEGEFRYKKTKTNFPVSVNGLKRSSIIDYGAGGISVAYIPTNGSKGKVTVFLVPDEITSDFDVRLTFLAATEAMVATSGSPGEASKYTVILDCKSFRVPGLAAEITRPDSSEFQYLSVFQCGKWTLKTRVTTHPSQRDNILNNTKELLSALRPEDIVGRFPFNPESNRTLIDRAILRDSILTTCAILGAYAELLWTEGHIGIMERRAGFPGLHLGGHVAALEIMLIAWQESEHKGDAQTKELMRSLEQIKANGFMKEFVMDGYNDLLIPAATDTLQRAAFLNWKKANSVSVDPTKRFFTIIYEK